jgi:L-seryl-tRNA(Ser) seleniumtransferase
MIKTDAEAIEARAQSLADALHQAGWTVAILSGSSAIGGGSAPGVELPTVLVAIERPGQSADSLAQSLRALAPPVIARIEDDRVVLDLRTVSPEQDPRLADQLRSLL